MMISVGPPLRYDNVGEKNLVHVQVSAFVFSTNEVPKVLTKNLGFSLSLRPGVEAFSFFILFLQKSHFLEAYSHLLHFLVFSYVYSLGGFSER